MQGRKVAAIVILGISTLKFIMAALECIKQYLKVTNPLIPDVLYQGLRNYSLFIAGCYFVAMILPMITLVTKKYFWTAILTSSRIIIAVSVFALQISDLFINIGHTN